MFDIICIIDPIIKVNIPIAPKIFLMPCGNLSLLKQTYCKNQKSVSKQTLIYFLPLLTCLHFLEFSMYVIRQSLFSFFSGFFDLFGIVFCGLSKSLCGSIVLSSYCEQYSTSQIVHDSLYSFTYYAHFGLLSVGATTNFGIDIFLFLFFL